MLLLIDLFCILELLEFDKALVAPALDLRLGNGIGSATERPDKLTIDREV